MVILICESEVRDTSWLQVRMVTGDNPITARAIAEECGILTPDGVIIEGKEFRGMSEEAMRSIIPRIDVSLSLTSTIWCLHAPDCPLVRSLVLPLTPVTNSPPSVTRNVPNILRQLWCMYTAVM